MRRTAIAALLGLALLGWPESASALNAYYLYNVSSMTGILASSWANLTYDAAHDELYVVSDGVARIFNRMGMEVHRFGRDDEVGMVLGLAVLEEGDLVVLASMNGKRAILRCDFRGARIEPFELKNLPASFEKFEPTAVVRQGDTLWFAEGNLGRVAMTDLAGNHRADYAIAALLKLTPKQRAEGGGGAFSVDKDGDMLVTVPNMWAAFVISPNREVRHFGQKGSAPGKFNIAGKLVSDEKGTYFLTDKLRSVVMVFDHDLQFQGEFGYRGDDPGNLIAPFDLAAGNGRVYVANAGNRGVSVFKVETAAPPPLHASP